MAIPAILAEVVARPTTEAIIDTGSDIPEAANPEVNCVFSELEVNLWSFYGTYTEVINTLLAGAGL